MYGGRKARASMGWVIKWPWLLLNLKLLLRFDVHALLSP